MKAMIVGAGIGGLTAAIALRRAGVETTVFERAGELREVGAGLLLAANAVRALDELGLSEKVRRLGTPASAARILSWRGETLTDGPADELEKRLGVAREDRASLGVDRRHQGRTVPHADDHSGLAFGHHDDAALPLKPGEALPDSVDETRAFFHLFEDEETE